MLLRISIIALSSLLLAGCDNLAFFNSQQAQAKGEADGRAVGAACRLGDRALEECYQLNPRSSRAAIFAGWREMNDYMAENRMASMPAPKVLTQIPLAPAPTAGTIPLSSLPKVLRGENHEGGEQSRKVP